MVLKAQHSGTIISRLISMAATAIYSLSLSAAYAGAQAPRLSFGNSSPESWYEQAAAHASVEAAAAREALQSTGQWSFSEVFFFPLADYWCENNVGVADFDHNGLKDIALLVTTRQLVGDSSQYTNACRVILLSNRGKWQFDASTIAEYPENRYGSAIQAGDMNGDGWADLVVRESYGTHVMLNNQHGGFSESWTGVPGNDAVSLADINDDSFLDILSGTQTGSGGRAETFVNNGSGTNFSKKWESPLYGDQYGTMNNLFPATLNNDHAPDIVATEIYDGILATFTGDGRGTAFTQRDLLYLGDRTFGLAVGNVNNDAFTDIAVSVGWGQARVFLAQNNTLSEIWRSPNLGQAAFNLALADFDRDGFDDLFVGTFSDGALRIYRNHLGADFELAWSASLDGEGYTGVAADMDDDGYPDLLVSEQNPNQQNYIRILRNMIPQNR